MRFLAVLLEASAPAWCDVVVSPDGSDDNPGTEAQPFRTLEKAREVIRTREGRTVWLRGGTYERASTFTLSAGDSGTTWRAWEGESVRITGGRVVKGFQPDQDRPGVYRVNLREQGITNFGKLAARGFGRAVQPAGLELSYRDQPMPLASWPDIGWAYTSAAQPGQFSVSTSRIERWTAEPDLWVHGYWTYDWADSYEHVASLDPAQGVIKTDPPHGVYGYAPEKRFLVLNALSELDQPGEWYLDRRDGTLYFRPPGPLADGDVTVSLLDTPLVSINGARDVRLENLGFEHTRSDAVQIRGSSGVVVSGCVLRNLGMRAVTIDGGSADGVENSEIYQTGEGGVWLNGGDRKSLTPAGHFARGNTFHRFSRWVRTYRPAVQIGGVGQQVLNNRISNCPHEAIALAGNDHLIEGNDIHTAAWETADVGAFYMGRDWTWRGNVLRANFFHNQGNGDVNSVYLDDCASGTLVEGNLFHRAGRSVFIGGGRDNIVRNNVFVDGNPSVEVDARGLTWARKWFNGEDPTLMDRLAAMPYKTPPWSERYPDLVNILDDEPAVPKGNLVEGNSWFGPLWTRLRDGTDKWVTARNNLQLDAPPGLDFPLPSGEVVNYRMEAVAGKPNSARLVVENLGQTRASGEALVWTWPEEVRFEGHAPVAYDLAPGEKLVRELTLVDFAGAKDVWAGARLRGDDLRPRGLKLAPR